MDVQGFGSTFASGFYQTATSGFGASGMGGSQRPQSSLMDKMSIDGASNPNLTEAGDDDEEERRA